MARECSRAFRSSQRRTSEGSPRVPTWDSIGGHARVPEQAFGRLAPLKAPTHLSVGNSIPCAARVPENQQFSRGNQRPPCWPGPRGAVVGAKVFYRHQFPAIAAAVTVKRALPQRYVSSRCRDPNRACRVPVLSGRLVRDGSGDGVDQLGLSAVTAPRMTIWTARPAGAWGFDGRIIVRPVTISGEFVTSARRELLPGKLTGLGCSPSRRDSRRGFLDPGTDERRCHLAAASDVHGRYERRQPLFEGHPHHCRSHHFG